MKYAESNLASGTTFENRYETLSKLGEGGFGTVYKARQLTTGQLVALKIMRVPDYGGETQRKTRLARFLREAKLCAQLHHPNIVQVIDVGQLEDGGLYTVFAFAPGDTLATILSREGNLAPDEAKHLMLQVLDALACAHAQGVVHRDLKPSNIMVVPTGARRNAVVLDFGIGSMFGGDTGSESNRLTGTNETVGTPGYSAPEQLRGLDPSPQADLFSWAIVFAECLTGRPVYTGTSAETLYQVLADEPVPLPATLRSLPFFDLLAKATTKKADARNITARDALIALEAIDFRGVDREALRGLAPKTDPVAWPSPTAFAESGTRERGRTGTGDRRHLTVLCCQLSVRAEARVDVESQDTAIRAALAICGSVAQAYGGRIMAALGDRLLIYFGYPRAEEDDVRRAGQAALAIASSIAQRVSEAKEPGANAVEVAIGIHCGPVSEDERVGSAGLVVGSTPLLCTKLAASATAQQQIVLSAEAERITRDFFEVEAITTSGTAPTFLLLGPRRSKVDDTSTSGAKSLIGREQEIELLLDRWRRLKTGMGQASLITGEAGIGKSTLVRDLRRRLQPTEHIFFECRCAPDTQHTALLPLIDLVQRVLGLDQEEEALSKVARLAKELKAHDLPLDEVMPLFISLLSLPKSDDYPLSSDISPQRQKDLTLDALLAFISAVADKKPLVLLVEDLHWADATTLELLTKLVREITSSQTFLVMTARPEYEPSFSTTSMLQIHLARLDASQIEALVAELVGHKQLPAALIERVIARTDGVPLFVEELTQMFLESGVLAERDGKYEVAGQLSDVEIPVTLRALLTARLDRLGRAKATAQLAAALGRDFSIEVLSQASPLGRVAVQEDLEKLTIAGLVLRKRRLRDPIGVFKHALVRDAVYDSLSRNARQEVHLGVARTLEEHFPEITRQRPDLLAHHYYLAEQSAQSVVYSSKAATQALERSAYADAIVHATKVVEGADALKDASDRVGLELAANGILAQALMATRGWGDPTVKKSAERSAELVKKLDPANPHRITTLWSLFAYHHTISNRDSARGIAEELVGLANASGDPGLQAAATTMLGCTLHPEGKILEAQRALLRVTELYDPEKHRQQGFQFGLDSLVIARTLLGHLYWFQGDSNEAKKQVAEGLRWAREVGHIASLAIGLLYGCQVYQFAGDTHGTAAMTGELLGLAAKYGLPAYEGYAAIIHGWTAGSEQPGESILGVLTGMGCNLCLTYYGALVAETQAAQQNFEKALSRIDHSIELAMQNNEFFFLPELHRRRAVYQQAINPNAPEIEKSLEHAALLGRRYEIPRVEILALRSLKSTEAHTARIVELEKLYPGLRQV